MTTHRALVLEVTQDPTRFFSEIAEHLHVGEGTVEDKIGDLEQQGLLKGYELEVDADKFDKESVAVVGFQSTPGAFAELLEELEGREELVDMVSSEEDHMVLVEAMFDGPEEMQAFIDTFDEENGVHRVSPAVVLHRAD
ncbi:MAG: Lrp/AsnC family transcriptional regulator [Candidatus Nanohaloarchaea archaeon]|nr:Lrp/AsnC family transcriptional regulator [Candidatus Nanohaloarchaea archaeon]